MQTGEISMNRFFSRNSLSLMLVAMSILTVPSLSLAAERAHRSRGAAQFTDTAGNFSGSGTATHLGIYTEIGNATIAADGALFASSIYTSTHSGDQLFATFTGQINGTGGITATVTYVGGTGNFANVSGSATLTGQIQPDGTIVVTVEGIIHY
jgi:hypothetical protein